MPPFPEAIAYVWGWFQEIGLGLQGNGMGTPIIAWGDLRDWQSEMGIECEQWEKLALIRLGHARAVIQGEKMASKTNTPGAK